ncbi:MAG: response regulator transcription factor [Acidobacteriaceae bacterium]|nr:response regulator transcription factor [Acidobacteriaceae bacterium]
MGRGKRVSQLLIADGNLLFRRGLRTLLAAESDLEVLDEASDVPEALAKVRVLSPDVLLMDLQMLEPEGQPGAFAIRQARPETAILFLTQEDSPQQLELAIAAGARGYMLKDSTAPQLVAGIRQVAFSNDQNPRALSKIVPDLQALAASNDGYPRGAVLTSREQEVMRLLAEGHTVREVAAELALSVKTVEAHKLNLMRKLDIHNRASLVEYAMQRGLIPQPVTQ